MIIWDNDSTDSEFERNKISPQEFTKNVLQECNWIKKTSPHVKMLTSGQSILSKGMSNPGYLANTSQTFYGKKLSTSVLLNPLKADSTIGQRNTERWKD